MKNRRQSVSIRTALSNSVTRKTLYADAFGRRAFLNPVFNEKIHSSNNTSSYVDKSLRDFLASMPSFSDFSDQQLSILETNALVKNFKSNEIIFKQGEEGDVFYVIHKGSVEVLVQEGGLGNSSEDYGISVAKLSQGFYFGERALLTTEPRAATIRALESTQCLVFSRDIFEEVISGSNALIGNDTNDSIDWSKDIETKSLIRHIEKIIEIDNDTTIKPKIKNIVYELNTAFTPELTVDEIVARVVMTVKSAMQADRVGLFILTEDKMNMILKISERSKGIRLPVRGLAGAVAESNALLNVLDAYQDSRFDATMDRRTGYRTRQVLGVPVRHPLSNNCIGVLQVNNRSNGTLGPYTEEEEKILQLAATQVSELLHGRADILINSSEESNIDVESGDEIILTNSCDITESFKVQLVAVSIKVDEEDIILPRRFIEITASLHLALSELCPSCTISVPFPRSVARDSKGNIVVPLIDKINFDISTRNLPRATRLMFRIALKKKRNDKLVYIGWTAVPIYDFKGCLESFVDLNLFDGQNDIPINTTLSNKNFLCSGGISALLEPNISSPKSKVLHCTPKRSSPIQIEPEELSDADKDKLNKILYTSFDPLSMTKLKDEDKEFIWNVRYNIVNKSELLPAFVMSIKWSDSERVQELYDLLDIWKAPTPLESLQLLDRRFMDPKVRAYAVHCIEELKDEELSLYMLQLVQQLKFENHVDSALSRLLLRRSLKNKRVIGHIFFWFLKSEVYNIDVKARFTTLLQIYLRNCGHHRIELGQQMYVMKRLEAIALKVVEGHSKVERLEILRRELREAVLPSEFQLPLDPHLKAGGFEVDGCRVMESKKKPLWLSLKNCVEGGKNIILMLKVGDDLRQDALILQMLKIMNNLWKKEGLDMQMMIYGCISTGDQRGLLEVVLNASTLGGILLDATDSNKSKKVGSVYRKLTSAMKALNDYSVLKSWIWDRVCDDLIDETLRSEEMEKRVQNFIVSTAAYCVASYVLGLGDRHNDNLMITKNANFFHIDFGHILGNFKSKYGIKRERASMVFTYAMKEVMRPDQFDNFVDLCCDIYNILRAHSSLLVSLFSLAIPCNLPELQREEDVVWIYEKLLVGKSDEDASIHFKSELEICLNTRATRLNDAVHMIAHA